MIFNCVIQFTLEKSIMLYYYEIKYEMLSISNIDKKGEMTDGYYRLPIM